MPVTAVCYTSFIDEKKAVRTQFCEVVTAINGVYNQNQTIGQKKPLRPSNDLGRLTLRGNTTYCLFIWLWTANHHKRRSKANCAVRWSNNMTADDIYDLQTVKSFGLSDLTKQNYVKCFTMTTLQPTTTIHLQVAELQYEQRLFTARRGAQYALE